MARILVVDDSSIARRFLIKILNSLNHEIVGQAESGEMAVIEYIKLKPDIVTMDLDMPGMGGFEASKRIHKIDPHSKVIIISAHDQNQLQEDCQGIIENYIIKPVNETNVSSAIAKVLQDKGAEIAAVQENKSPSKGKKVLIWNCNLKEPFKGILVETSDEFTVFSMGDSEGQTEFVLDSAIVLGYQEGGVFLAIGETIISVDRERNLIKCKNETLFKSTSIKNIFEKFPVSMVAILTKDDHEERNEVIVKSLSINTIKIISDSVIEQKGEGPFNLTINNGSKDICLKVQIAGENKQGKKLEYDLRVESIDEKTSELFRQFNLFTREQHVAAIKGMLNEADLIF